MFSPGTTQNFDIRLQLHQPQNIAKPLPPWDQYELWIIIKENPIYQCHWCKQIIFLVQTSNLYSFLLVQFTNPTEYDNKETTKELIACAV